MPTLLLDRKVASTRRPAAVTRATFLQAVLAACFALVVVAIVVHPTIVDPDSPLFSVAGP